MSINCRVLKGGSCEITQFYGGASNHLGIDIVGKGYTLDTILAHTDGTVCFVQTGQVNNQGSTGNASYGNFVKLDHGNGYYTLYAHMEKVYVTNGQKVSKGQELGYMGNTGNSYGAHCHFEVFIKNVRTDPYEYLNRDLFTVIQVTPVVARDENKNQLKVNFDDLRVRKSSSINSEIIGMAQINGIYNYYETKVNEGYTWYRIADNQWVANEGTWCTIYPKKEEEDEAMIEELKKQVEQLENEKSKLEKEVQALKDEDNSYETFIASETKAYGINLKKGEIVKYKKAE